MKLKRQGFYREMPHGEKCPSILDYTDKVNQKKAEKIFQYLNEGKVLVAWFCKLPGVKNGWYMGMAWRFDILR